MGTVQRALPPLKAALEAEITRYTGVTNRSNVAVGRSRSRRGAAQYAAPRNNGAEYSSLARYAPEYPCASCRRRNGRTAPPHRGSRAGGEALFEFVQDIPGHGCRSASGFDPISTQTSSTSSASAWITPCTWWVIDDASAVKNLVSNRRTRGRGDRACDQKQSGRVRQQAGLGKGFPWALECRRRAIALAPQTKPGFLAGFADRRDRQRARPRRRDLRAALHQVGFELLCDRGGDRNAVVGLVDAAAGKTNLPGMNTTLSWRLPTRTSAWRPCDRPDQRGGVDGAAIGVMVGFLLVSCNFAHLAPRPCVSCFLFERPPDLFLGILFVESMHAQRPLHPDHGAFHRLQQQQ